MADELELIQAMSVLRVQPGDVIVLKANMSVPAYQSIRIRNAFSEATGLTNKIIVLSDGLDLGILRDESRIEDA